MSLFKPRIVNPGPYANGKRDYVMGGLPVGQTPTTHSGHPRDTLIGPVSTFLTTFITTTIRGPPKDTVADPEAIASTTVVGGLETIPGHSRDTMTGPASSFDLPITTSVAANVTTLTSATTISGPDWLATSSSSSATGPNVTRVL